MFDSILLSVLLFNIVAYTNIHTHMLSSDMLRIQHNQLHHELQASSAVSYMLKATITAAVTQSNSNAMTQPHVC